MSDEDRQMAPLPEDVEETPWTAVDSSNVHSIRHVDGVLQVRFKDRSGKLSAEYHYDGVSEEEFEKLRAADSIRGHLQEHFINQGNKGVKMPAPVPSS